MVIKSRRLKITSPESGLPDGYGYCRRCRRVKNATQFSKAVDRVLDTNDLFSVCKTCVDELYVSFLSSNNGSIDKAILKLCRMLNVEFNPSAIDSAIKQIESKNSDKNSIFGIYRAKLLVVKRTSVLETSEDFDLTYKDMNLPSSNRAEEDLDELSYADQEVIDFWGKGFTPEEYRWLEKTLDYYKKTHKCDTATEESLLRQIVFKEYDIRKAREEGSSPDSHLKQLQELMKTAAVDPSKSNIANAGKSQDTFSAFIKLIEENEPAEIFGDERDAFKDFQGIKKYFDKYVTRPMKNFITGSRDFNVDNESDDDEYEDLDLESLNLITGVEEDIEEVKNTEESQDAL